MAQFLLCEDTGLRVDEGDCPVHGGDACLRIFIPLGDVEDALLVGLREATDDGHRTSFEDLLLSYGYTREGLALLTDAEE